MGEGVSRDKTGMEEHKHGKGKKIHFGGVEIRTGNQKKNKGKQLATQQKCIEERRGGNKIKN